MQLFANNATSRLVAGISNVSLSMQVIAGDGIKFPNPTGGDFFLLTLSKVTSGIESAVEVVKVTARATDVFTIVRAQEGTTALVYAEADFVQLRMTAATATSNEAHKANVTNPHVVTAAQVGLGNVDNTSDVNKPVSTAQAAANTAVQNAAAPIAHVGSGGTAHANVIAGGATGFMSGADKTKLDAVTGTNTGDETLATIKTKLGITTLSGSNTGDQTLPTLASLGAEATANKDATGGYAGLTLFKINFKNALNTFTSFFTNANTAARTYTFQDRDGTIADNTDLALKAGLAANAFTGKQNFTAHDYKVTALGTITGTNTLDLSTAQEFTATLTATAVTWAFSNAPAANKSQVIYLRLVNAGLCTMTWPASTKFVAGALGTLTSAGTDVLGVKYDSTTSTYMVFVIGKDVK